MKNLILFFINIYQLFFSPFIKAVFGFSGLCRFTPSCSEYAKIVIKKKGVARGSCFFFLRLLSCQPFYNWRKI